MRYLSIAVALAMAISLGCTTVAQAAPCKGSLTYGFFYAKSVGGGYLEYMNAIHNATAKPMTFTLHVWGLRSRLGQGRQADPHRRRGGDGGRRRGLHHQSILRTKRFTAAVRHERDDEFPDAIADRLYALGG